MTTAFLVVANQALLEEEMNIYLELREELGYQKGTYPNMIIPQEDDNPLWKSIDPGLVETREEANQLLAMLEQRLPNYEWKIEEKEYPNIKWNRVDKN